MIRRKDHSNILHLFIVEYSSHCQFVGIAKDMYIETESGSDSVNYLREFPCVDVDMILIYFHNQIIESSKQGKILLKIH